MGERVSSEDPSVRTFRAHIESSGALNRPRLELPSAAADHVPVEVVRLVLDGSQYHADVRHGDPAPVVHGAYDNARLARAAGEGVNRLPAWLEAVGLGIGRSVQFDVVVPDFLYGARPPGTSTVYEAVEPPSASLASLAESLDE